MRRGFTQNKTKKEGKNDEGCSFCLCWTVWLCLACNDAEHTLHDSTSILKSCNLYLTSKLGHQSTCTVQIIGNCRMLCLVDLIPRQRRRARVLPVQGKMSYTPVSRSLRDTLMLLYFLDSASGLTRSWSRYTCSFGASSAGA